MMPIKRGGFSVHSETIFLTKNKCYIPRRLKIELNFDVFSAKSDRLFCAYSLITRKPRFVSYQSIYFLKTSDSYLFYYAGSFWNKSRFRNYVIANILGTPQKIMKYHNFLLSALLALWHMVYMPTDPPTKIQLIWVPGNTSCNRFKMYKILKNGQIFFFEMWWFLHHLLCILMRWKRISTLKSSKIIFSGPFGRKTGHLAVFRKISQLIIEKLEVHRCKLYI